MGTRVGAGDFTGQGYLLFCDQSRSTAYAARRALPPSRIKTTASDTDTPSSILEAWLSNSYSSWVRLVPLLLLFLRLVDISSWVLLLGEGSRPQALVAICSMILRNGELPV